MFALPRTRLRASLLRGPALLIACLLAAPAAQAQQATLEIQQVVDGVGAVRTTTWHWLDGQLVVVDELVEFTAATVATPTFARERARDVSHQDGLSGTVPKPTAFDPFDTQHNVVLGKPVAAGQGTLYGADPSTLTDGAFLPASTPWQVDTVYWWDVDATVEIDLLGAHELREVVIQADDNDDYVLEYWDELRGTWRLLWAVPDQDRIGFGMQTRPDHTDVTETFVFATPVVTDRIRVRGTGGDESYAVSELQLYGVKVF